MDSDLDARAYVVGPDFDYWCECIGANPARIRTRLSAINPAIAGVPSAVNPAGVGPH